MISLGAIVVRPTLKGDLPAFWEILSVYKKRFIYPETVTSKREFADWWKLKVKDSLTGMDDKGEIVGAGFLTQIIPESYAVVNVFKRLGYANPRLINVFQEGMEYFFLKHNLVKLIGFIEPKNRASLLLMKMCGFSQDGIMRAHNMQGAERKDMVMVSILEEELWKLTGCLKAFSARV